VLGKHDLRLKLLQNAARRYGVPVVYCNQVGGNDELVFDGNSCVVDAQGRLIAHARDFGEDLLVVDVPEQAGAAPAVPAIACPARSGIASVYAALVLGMGDYIHKCGFRSVVLGLSGGIDSAVTCALAVAAVGSENVCGVSMPSRYSSAGSRDDASELARRLGIAFHTVPIQEPHHEFDRLLIPYFQGKAADMTEENIQARIRGVILMAFSNKFNSLLVTTGNKSELAVGYCTLYGDMCGGLAAISDVPKTMVWELARWINESPDSPLVRRFGGPVIPESSITKVPSAELRPNQTDQDSLPPYELLDQVIELYVERERSVAQIIEQTGFDAQTVLRIATLIDRNEYKRKQAAPGLKITGRAFGFGRRMPMAQRFDNRLVLQMAKG
jgi:NAD+ synthetase